MFSLRVSLSNLLLLFQVPRKIIFEKAFQITASTAIGKLKNFRRISPKKIANSENEHYTVTV